MATVIFVDKENGCLRTPAMPSKLRGRLQSAPGGIPADKCLKTPLSQKPRLGATLQSGRKALGTVNKIVSTPVCLTGPQKNKSLAPSTSQRKVKTRPQEDAYPEVEKLIPYNPLDFEIYEAPEEIRLSHLCLSGLTKSSLPGVLSEEDDFEVLETYMEMSPMKIPREDRSAELESFLQTVSQLTMDLPPEPDY